MTVKIMINTLRTQMTQREYNPRKFFLGYLFYVFLPCMIAGSIGAMVSSSCGILEESVDKIPKYCYYIYQEEYLNSKLKGPKHE